MLNRSHRDSRSLLLLMGRWMRAGWKSVQQRQPAGRHQRASRIQLPEALECRQMLAAANYVPNHVLIGLQSPADAQTVGDSLTSVLPGFQMKSLGSYGVQLVILPEGIDVPTAITRLSAQSGVRYAEPDYIGQWSAVPNDPDFNRLWGLRNTGQVVAGVTGTDDKDIDADAAWNISTGGASPLVAIVDSGMDYLHPDLAANVWTNPGEIDGNGVDDDLNGYVDDIHGYDFADGDADPMDFVGHGTHVSGTVGAVGNNGIGLTGVNWQTNMMALKIGSDLGGPTTSGAVAAINYAVAMGAKVSNHSYSVGSTFSLQAAITNARLNDHIVVVAAGNSSIDNDIFPVFFPAAYTDDNIVVVAATDQNDALASFSNYGATTVDLGAPGVNIWSTTPRGGSLFYAPNYDFSDGTSMAAPHVTGAVALLRSVAPDLTYTQIINILTQGTDKIASLDGRVSSNGRLNLAKSLALIPETSISISTSSVAENAGTSAAILTIRRVASNINNDVQLDLSVNDLSEVEIPLFAGAASGKVTIPANQTEIQIPINIIDDTLLDGTQIVTFDLRFNGKIQGNSPLQLAVTDHETLTTSFSLNEVSENAGAGGAKIVVTRSNTDIAGTALTVQLSSSDTSELTTPVTAVFEAGQSSVTVDVTIVDDNLLDGSQTVIVSAQAAGYVAIADSITVLDTESVSVKVLDALKPSVREDAGTISDGVLVSRTDIDGPYTWSEVQLFPKSTDDKNGVTILDRDTVISTIVVPPQVSQVADVKVTLNLKHQELGDLDVFLVSPGGIRVELFSDLVTNGQEMIETTLDSRAFESIVNAVAPFSGNYLPEGRLENLEGINPTGTWILEITDDNRLDTGTLESWSLSITTLGLAPLDVTLTSSDTTEATVPSIVRIPANQTEVIAPLTAVPDSLLDGTQTVTITASAPAGSGLLDGSDTVNISDYQVLVFNVSGRTMSEAAGPSGLKGTVSRTNTNLASELIVYLQSSDTTEATVPASVTIPAGKSFALFDISAVNDVIEDGTQSVTISVRAEGYVGYDETEKDLRPSQTIEVTDFETQLQLSTVSTTVSENAGSFKITVRRVNAADTSQQMIVSLASDQPGEITVPSSVTIPAGQFSATFTATVINDNILENTEDITITATNADVPFGGELIVSLTDYEPLSVTVSPGFVYEAEITKGDGKNVVQGTVTRNNSDVSQDLVVTLSTADVRELTVPATVTIPAGQASATFLITAVNDNTVQPIGATLRVDVRASAPGFINGVKSVQILDHEPPVLTSPAVKSSQDVPLVQVAEARPVIRWQPLQGAIRYDLVIKSLTLGATVVQRSGLTTTSFTPTDDLGIGRYSVQVRAYDALERPGFWSEPRDFIVRTAPALRVPPRSNGFAATTTFPTISWTAVRDATRYDVWVDNLTTGQEQVIRQPFLKTTSFTPKQVMPPGRYRIWVRAINEQNDVGYWSSQTILLVQAPPVVTSPQGGSFDRTPTYTWTSVAIVDHYELWVSDIRTRNIPLVHDILIKGTTKFSTEELPPGEYLAWVRSFSNTVASAWSTPSRFRVSLPPVFTELAGENPASDGATFSWTSVADTKRYELFVYSLVGQPERQGKKLVAQTNLTGTTYTHSAALAPGRYRAWVRSISVMGEETAWNSVIFEVADHRGVPVPENSGFDTDTLQNTVIPVSLSRDGVVHGSVFISTPESSHEVSATMSEHTRSAADQNQRTDLTVSGDSDAAIAVAAPAVAQDAAACDSVMSDWNAAEWWAEAPASAVQQIAEVTDRTLRPGKQNRTPVADNLTAVQ